uniref:Uncharacterized protein n=1 Tax=Vannella robusta TaxID=1487602 RepID=A0A7S4HPT4_9EUKA
MVGQKTRGCKVAIRTLMRYREAVEKTFYKICPYFIAPWFACCLIAIKSQIVAWMIDPFIMGAVAIASIVSCITRLFDCKHGKDCLGSCLECFWFIDDCVGLYWDVAWWRVHERGEDLVNSDVEMV